MKHSYLARTIISVANIPERNDQELCNKRTDIFKTDFKVRPRIRGCIWDAKAAPTRQLSLIANMSGACIHAWHVSGLFHVQWSKMNFHAALLLYIYVQCVDDHDIREVRSNNTRSTDPIREVFFFPSSITAEIKYSLTRFIRLVRDIFLQHPIRDTWRHQLLLMHETVQTEPYQISEEGFLMHVSVGFTC